MRTFEEEVNRAAGICIDILVADGRLKRAATFRRKLKVNVKNTRGSYGGLTRDRSPTITISRDYENAKGHFWEYSRIRSDDGIGEFESDDNRCHVYAVVAHEIAHAVDHWHGDFSNHGGSWRRLYRFIRFHLGLTKDNDYHLVW